MTRSGGLRILLGESEFVCELLTEVAPRTSKAVSEMLPIRGRLIHGALSGPEVFVEIDSGERIQPENWTSNVLPGDVCYYFQKAGMIDRPRDLAEVCIFYARGGRPSSPEGPVAVNVFGRIDASQLDSLAETCKALRQYGPIDVIIEATRR